jgi:hypothetical protein
MQSHLTRHIFRQILRNEPVTHVQCLYTINSPRLKPTTTPKYLPQRSQRSLFGLPRRPKQNGLDPSRDPGYEHLIVIKNLLTQKIRTPSGDFIAKVLTTFFNTKQKDRTQLLDIQLEHALPTFKHLLEIQKDDEGARLSQGVLQAILEVLGREQRTDNDGAASEMADLVFQELQKQLNGPSPVAGTLESSNPFWKNLQLYVDSLMKCGKAIKARDVLVKEWSKGPDGPKELQLWTELLSAFQAQKNDNEYQNTVKIMQENGVELDLEAYRTLCLECAARDDIEGTKKWYREVVSKKETRPLELTLALLRLCIRHEDDEWGQALVNTLLENTPEKRSWDLILQWAVVTGRGVDEVERMMRVMIRRSEIEGQALDPDVETINGLIELANLRNDPYMAERFVALAEKWKIRPNARQYVLQMEYRLKVGDLDGARAVWRKLQPLEVPREDEVRLLNRLILGLCNAKSREQGVLTAFIEDLQERRGRFEAATLAAVVVLHLRSNEPSDATALLNSHALHYDRSGRALVSSAIADYILDPRTPTAYAWPAYTVLRQVFTETPRDVRTTILKSFFARARPDMATHVFAHMRQSAFSHQRPSVEAYIAVLEGIASAAEPNNTTTPDASTTGSEASDINDDAMPSASALASSSLPVVLNMLRLDSSVEPDTPLRDALMRAYLRTGQPARALELWDDTVYSREGPSYASITLALQACGEIEGRDEGIAKARGIWQRLQKTRVEISTAAWEAYMTALARQGDVDGALQLVESAMGAAEVRGRPAAAAADGKTIAILLNACPPQMVGHAEARLQTAHPDLWALVKDAAKAERGGRIVYDVGAPLPHTAAAAATKK